MATKGKKSSLTEVAIVLDPIVTVEGFAEGAYGAGWRQIDEIAASDFCNYERVYRRQGRDKENTIHYVEDRRTQVRYAVVRGPKAEAIAEEVRERFDYLDDADLPEGHPRSPG